MADETPTGKKPRAAVVVYTADGRRLKPSCPMCGETYWGKLVPPEIPPDTTVEPMIPARLSDGRIAGMAFQLWVCLNCGFLWHRTGSSEQGQSRNGKGK